MAGRWARGSTLVDPHSKLFKLITRVFEHFEYQYGVTVFQPPSNSLSVELRRLELPFEVNNRGLLQCKELRAEIDPNQDAGTWYGLDSKIVLRDVLNSSLRTILVPMGPVRTIRHHFHVSVRVNNEGTYGRFTINNVLGRLDCPAEPWLLYLKAQFHAYTSFVFPDPLTGRTGTEEAVHCLHSAFCQPWTVLNVGPICTLEAISKLIPSRTYYPSGLKTMQRVIWDQNLTSFIQNEGLWSAIEPILQKARALNLFALKQDAEIPNVESPSDMFLLSRAYWRRNLYQRPNAGFPQLNSPPDAKYEARDQVISAQARLNVFECTTLIKEWSPEICAPINLAATLQKWSRIGGFDSSFDKFLLSDLLEVELDTFWGSLVNVCRSSGMADRYRLMFMFDVISFRATTDMTLIRTLLAFAVIHSLKEFEPPKWPAHYNFRLSQCPTVSLIKQWIKPFRAKYAEDERSLLPVSYKTRRRLEASQRAHESKVDIDCDSLIAHLLAQWPCPKPSPIEYLMLVDVPQAMNVIQPEWLRLFQNIELSDYVAKVQPVLDVYRSSRKIQPEKVLLGARQLFKPRARVSALPTLSRDLLCRSLPSTSLSEFELLSPAMLRGTISAISDSTCQIQTSSSNIFSKENDERERIPRQEISELKEIIKQFENSGSVVQTQYCADLMQSIRALERLRIVRSHNNEKDTEDTSSRIELAKREVQERFDMISRALDMSDSRSQWLKEAGLWPCLTPVSVLEQLRSSAKVIFGAYMKEMLIAYAVSLVSLQRVLRMQDAKLNNNNQRLFDERKNTPHVNWNPLEHPDWVLLEIEANISIRQDQVDVARATISPPSGTNSVLQMNMGQGKTHTLCLPPSQNYRLILFVFTLGKTSCIMPMVAAELADTTRIVRLVVPRALLGQTAQLLQARLGGLVGREIRHVPFSRETPTNLKMVQEYFDIHRDICKASGVIVTLPEHILSFKLSGLQRLLDSRSDEAKAMIKIHGWMQKWSRDILDECDFTLATRTQLIYPSGSQSAVDGHPYRWEAAQELLRLVKGHLLNLQIDFPHSIEVIAKKGGSFPTTFILRPDAEEELIARLVEDITRGRTSILPIRDCTSRERVAVKSFISNGKVTASVMESICQILPDNIAAKQNIYLLRGLLVHRILLLCLKKRWNVQYGLHPDRDPIAVPFTAKGVPSDQAEWGHPDVAILFTCLAFYFGGLSQVQLQQSIQHLIKSDDPSGEYDRWTHSADDLPSFLGDWNAIQADDEVQLSELWHYLRYQIVVIDYFLNHFVFPKHAKQFQVKLQASGWDIPLFHYGSQSLALTTGFSGTNDNRSLLPLNIEQRDLPALSHTNAEVLTYLLQPRNREYVVAAGTTGRRLSEEGLLELLYKRGIHMLIDAGAQILEMDNYNLAKAWLRIAYDVPAALYFNADNKPLILYRNGRTTPLLASPFADDLRGCLVYLDEAHTRGTDLKMPPGAVGALTLGLGQTKDHTVQGKQKNVNRLHPSEKRS